MGSFKRGLDSAFTEVLNQEYDKGGWWRGFVDDPDLFLAVRDGYVNVYYRGCSLLKWEAGAPNWKIHYKYLLRPEVEDLYVKVDGGTPNFGDEMKGFFIGNLAELDSLKKAAQPYAGDEKTGVHNVILANENVLDVEIQWCGDPNRLSCSARDESRYCPCLLLKQNTSQTGNSGQEKANRRWSTRSSVMRARSVITDGR